MYGVADDAIAVHLYGDNVARLDVSGRTVTLTQNSHYPWDGAITISVETDSPTVFTLYLRIPGWARKAALSINGEPVDLASATTDGYARVTREWRGGDRVALDLDMSVERIWAHPEVRQDAGRVAFMRGPLLYCLESADNSVSLNRLRAPDPARFECRFEPELLGGITTLSARAEADATADWAQTLYRTEPVKTEAAPIKAIPYFAWDNREPGEMLVWLRGD
jgi:hypothetical protein